MGKNIGNYEILEITEKSDLTQNLFQIIHLPVSPLNLIRLFEGPFANQNTNRYTR
jgi:hypothetical protein